MSKVTKATSMFTKLCWVSTLETPRAPHLALVSTASGGIRPKIHPEAKGFSITVADGAKPVSMVAWKQAAVETSRAAQVMAAIGRMGPSVVGEESRRQYARPRGTPQISQFRAGAAEVCARRNAGRAWENWIQMTAPRINAIAPKVRAETGSPRRSQPRRTAIRGFT